MVSVDSATAALPLLTTRRCGLIWLSFAWLSPTMYCTFNVGIGPQAVPMQTFGDPQSVLLAQVVLHAVAPQMNGVHIDVVAAPQVPVPLQVRADVAVETL